MSESDPALSNTTPSDNEKHNASGKACQEILIANSGGICVDPFFYRLTNQNVPFIQFERTLLFKN